MQQLGMVLQNIFNQPLLKFRDLRRIYTYREVLVTLIHVLIYMFLFVIL